MPSASIFCLQIGDQLAVFRVHLGQRAEFAATAEAGDELLIGQHQAALVGEEELEAGDAVLADQARHLVGKAAPHHDTVMWKP